MRRFQQFTTDEIRYMQELFGDEIVKDRGARALWGEVEAELQERARSGDPAARRLQDGDFAHAPD